MGDERPKGVDGKAAQTLALASHPSFEGVLLDAETIKEVPRVKLGGVFEGRGFMLRGQGFEAKDIHVDIRQLKGDLIVGGDEPVRGRSKTP